MFLASSEDGVVRIDHVDDVKSYELNARVLGDAKTHRQGDDPDRFNSFFTKAIEGLHLFFELLLIKAHFVEGCKEKDFRLATVINEDFGDVPSIDVDGDDHGVCVGE
jgi:hypothetical protein